MKLLRYIKIFVLIFINNYLFAASLSGSVIIDNTDKSFSFSDKALIIEDTGGTFGSVKITSPGSFIFPNTVNDHKNHSYSLKLTQIPDNQFICTTNQSSGAVFLNDKTDLIILCKGKYYISINVSGLSNDDNYSIVDNNQRLSFNAANTNITQTFAQWYYYNFNYYLKAYFNYTSSNYKRCSNYSNGTITDNVTINISCNTSNFNKLYFPPIARAGAVSWMDNYGNAYIFGGYSFINGRYTYYNDLWMFNGITWSQIVDNGVIGSPSPRYFSVSWTDKLGNAYVFGGYSFINGRYTYYNDLWMFNGTSWVQVIANGVNSSPSARYGAVSWMDNYGNAYIFSGYNSVYFYNDLWRFNGTSWVQVIANGVNSSPSARYGAVAWTDNNGNAYVFGGYSDIGFYYNDLWQFNGSNWTQLIANGVTGSPSSRWGAVSWTNKSSNAYVFGGYNNGYYYNDLWGFIGNTWVQIIANGVNGSPSARASSTSWTDNQGYVYVFGGKNSTFLNDLWKIDKTNWSQIYANSVNKILPRGRSGAVSWIDNLGNTYLFGGSGNSIYNDLWKYNGSNWTQLIANGVTGSPSSRWCAVSWTDNNGNAYVFGGAGNTLYNDLWKFNGTIWSQITNAGTPPSPRFGAVSWMDKSGNAYVFGGYNDTTYLNDLWKFNGTTWTQVIISRLLSAPNARFGAVSWTDNDGNAYVFGGYAYDSNYNDLWRFNGTTWTQVIANGESNSPAGRVLSISWTDNIGNAYVFGGYAFINGRYTYYNDLWKFNGTSWSQITDVGILPNAVYGATSWLDNVGNVYIFGGYNGLTYSNDLFKI